MAGVRRLGQHPARCWSSKIQPDGGVKIVGSEYDLEQLRSWLLVALVHGSAAPTFVTDLAKTSIVIEVAPVT